jgi:uncharacterized membrane protein YfcA
MPDLPILILMIVIVIAAGLSTGATGLGFAQLTAVGLSFVLDARTAVILLALTVPPVSTVQLLRHRGSVGEWRSRMLVLSAGCIVGVPLGAYLLTVLPESAIAIVLGLFTLFFIATRLRRPTFSVDPSHERIAAPVVGLIGGVFNGTIGVSGPILGSYLIALGVKPSTFAFTIQILFLTMTLVRLVGLVALGEVTGPMLGMGAMLLVPSLTGQAIGFRIQERVSPAGFERGVLVVMAVAAVGLLVRGLTGGG